MSREYCWRCRRPLAHCLCPSTPPLETRTRLVLLMHPKEWRREKCATGRITSLNLARCEIIPGMAFDCDPRVRELIDDPGNYCALLYPGPDAMNLDEAGFPKELVGDRKLVIFLVDATWACSRVVLRENPGLLTLPRLMFQPREPSRFIIKRQPAAHCLSTLEAVHELLLSLEAAGLDNYTDKERLLTSFSAMQDLQLERHRKAAAGRMARDSR